MESAHGVEVRCRRAALACLELLDEGLDIGCDQYLRGGPLLSRIASWLLMLSGELGESRHKKQDAF
jgi:hypothetical protein